MRCWEKFFRPLSRGSGLMDIRIITARERIEPEKFLINARFILTLN
jgi:hypothetical protein